MQFTIEKNIPVRTIVRARKPRSLKYPLDQMDVGDSFAFPIDMFNKVSACASGYGKNSDRKFKCRRQCPNTGRVWRVK